MTVIRSLLNRIWRYAFLEIALAVFLFALALGVIRQQSAQQATQVGAQHLMALNVAYNATLETYRLEVSTRYKLEILRPAVLDIMEEALASPEDAMPPIRGRLYRMLRPVHDDLKSNGLVQFQFHLADDRVLLRLHTPTQSGDALFTRRPLLRLANEKREAVSGFEIGRYLPSFRYIFPMGRNEDHYGSVEISLPFDQIQEKVSKLLPASEFGLLLNRSVIESNIDTTQQEKFSESRINSGFLIEHPTLSLVSKNYVSSKTIADLEPILKSDPYVGRRMAEGIAFTVPVLHDEKGYMITFMPISGIEGRNFAYIVRFTPADSLIAARNAMWFQTGAALLLVLALAFSIHHLRRQQRLLREDIARRKAVEVELEAHRHRLEDMVQERSANLTLANEQLTKTLFAMERVGIGITWANIDTGRFEYANRFMAEFLGYTDEELLQLGVADINPAYPANTFSSIVKTIREHGHIKFETLHRKKNGVMAPVEMTVFYHEGSPASPPMLIAFMVDIAERKLHEEALLEAKRVAEAATMAKSAFLANTSHEIRTPLNAITGMAHLIRRSGLEPKQAERLDKLEAASEHLLSVINAILDLSKIEAGKFMLEEVPVRIDRLLENVVTILRERAVAKHLVVRTEVSQVSSRLVGDTTRLQQALINYLGNAIKFTEVGSITIRVFQVEETAEDALIRFEVQDTGIGIDQKTIARLFTAFEQADNSTTRQYGGTGLGLAITRKIANLMRGEAGAESVQGQGSTFWFTARLKKGETDTACSDGMSQESAESLIKKHFLNTRVLLADDEPVNREITQLLLEEIGLLADEAEDGRQAVFLATHNDYALILMDMQMPVLDGLDATLEIRQLEKHRTTPVLAMTANAFVEDKERCIKAGMNDFITKPVDPEHFFELLLKWLQLSRPY